MSVRSLLSLSALVVAVASSIATSGTDGGGTASATSAVSAIGAEQYGVDVQEIVEVYIAVDEDQDSALVSNTLSMHLDVAPSSDNVVVWFYGTDGLLVHSDSVSAQGGAVDFMYANPHAGLTEPRGATQDDQDALT